MRRITLKRRFEQIQVKSRIASQLRSFHPDIRKTLVNNISDFVVALVQARHVHSAKIAEKLNRDGNEASREQWIRRQLDNDTMGTWQLFKPMAECLLKGLVGHAVYLILDPTDLDAERCTVMIMLAYRGRALPLLWMSFEMKPGMIHDSVTLLFAELQHWLPEGVKVYLLADREFHGVDMLALICQQGWIPVVRGKGDTTATLSDGTRQPLSAWTPPVGQMTFQDYVWLTARQFGPMSLSASCAPAKPGKPLDPWFIISTEPAGPQIIRVYEKRFWIDETFRDFKGYGFHLDETGIHDPERLDRLVLMIALACWWVLSIGIWLHRMGLRAEVDRVKHPKLSLFQLGLRYINRLLHLGEIPDVQLIPILIGAL
jgi:hypothetical protein